MWSSRVSALNSSSWCDDSVGIRRLRVNVAQNSPVLRFAFGEMSYATYIQSGMVCSEKAQPFINNGFACSCTLSCVTMFTYVAAI